MILVINFKTYKEATGKNAVNFAKICKGFSKKTRLNVFVAPQASDIGKTSNLIPTIAQHVDYFSQDQHTGALLPEEIKANGAVGSIINHSEHKLGLKEIKETVKRCKSVGLKTFVCTASLGEAKKITKFNPNYIAYEVPELIGTGVSITKVKASSVQKFVKLLKNKKSIPLCGAGISSNEDVQKALDLGCKGILISSAFVKSRNPEKMLRYLVQ